MRARADPLFSNFLLRVGNRVKEAIDGSYIRIPGDMAIPYTDDSNSRDDLINAIFPSLETNAHSSEYIISRAILSTKTRMLMRLMINSSVDFTERRKFIIVLDEVEDDNNNFYPMEFSNSLNVGKENGEMLLDSISNGHFNSKRLLFRQLRLQQRQNECQYLKSLTPEEKTRISCDIKATNIILLGLPSDIYTFSNHHKIARDILNMVKELIEGTELTKQERESKLYDKFDRFTTDKVEAIKSYYLRYAKLINIIGMGMTRLQINTKFVNYLQP
ncbi:hypothetical protein Tco_1202555 [Tanacetum coccineum]